MNSGSYKTLTAVAPEAIQILDYAHAKSYLYDAAKIIYGTVSHCSARIVVRPTDIAVREFVGWRDSTVVEGRMDFHLTPQNRDVSVNLAACPWRQLWATRVSRRPVP